MSRPRALLPLPARRTCPSSPAFCAQLATRADVLAAWLRVGVAFDDTAVCADIVSTDAGARNLFRGYLREHDRRVAAGEVRASDRREAHAVAVTRAFVAFRAVAEVQS